MERRIGPRAAGAHRDSIRNVWLCLLSACAFPDPNAPPPPDPLLIGAPERPSNGEYYTVKVDGIADCTSGARPNEEDTILVFTGSEWNRDSALRRAQDAFFGVIEPGKPVTADDVHVDDPFEDAIGYCVVNAGTGTEITMVSVCGQRGAGRTGCVEFLGKQAKTMKGLTAEWHDCPGDGDFCPEVPEEPCATEPGNGKSFAAYLDVAHLRCGTSGQPDERDTLLITTSGGYTLSTAACLTQWPYVWGLDVGGAQALTSGTFQPQLAPLVHSTMRTELALAGSSTLPTPAVPARGYCLVYEGEQVEYVLYNFCDSVELPDAQKDDPSVAAQWSPEALCAGLDQDGHSVTASPDTTIKAVKDADGGITHAVTSTPRPGRPSRWISCQGKTKGPLCF